MTVLFGLAAAIAYGLGDFAGGIASRRVGTSITVLLWSYPVGAVLMAALLPVYPGRFTERALLFGVLGGAAGLLGVTVMYGLMTVAPINVISPVTAVLAAVVPIVVGLGLGERPSTAAWLGIVIGLGAVVLVSRTGDDTGFGRIGAGVLVGALVAGLGFGMYFVFLARAGDGTGVWPLLVSRVASAVLIVPLAAARGAWATVRGRTLAVVLGAGACDALANLFFLISTRHGLLSLASVLTSLYPATTVVLAVWLLHERLNAVQRVGLALAAAAIVLITV